MNEEIRQIVGYEGLYTISETGVVTNARTGLERKAIHKADGYMIVQLWKENRSKVLRIHRLVAETFLGPVPPGMEVNHKDGDKGHNSRENLEYVTRSQNMKHAMDRGFYPIGEHHPAAKLSPEDVISVRERFASGERCPEIAKSLGVSNGAIHQILKQQSWKRLNGGPVHPSPITSIPRKKGTGVYRMGRRWVARIRLNKQVVNVGYFDSFEEATAARECALSGGPRNSVAELITA